LFNANNKRGAFLSASILFNADESHTLRPGSLVES
jgi:hypothetical protein